VTCRIKWLRYYQSIWNVSLSGNISLRDLHELLFDWPNELEGELDFFFWVLGFYCCANNGNVTPLLAYTVHIWHHHDVDVILSSDLSLRNDYLHWWNILCVRNGVVQDAYAPDDSIDHLHSIFESWVDYIGWIADQHVAFGYLSSTLDAWDLAVLEKNFVHIGIKHEGSSIDSTNSRKSFGNTSQSVDRIDEGRVSVSSHGVHV